MTLTSALTLVPEEPLGMQDSRPQSFNDQKGVVVEWIIHETPLDFPLKFL